MKTLSTKAILYDANCPLCNWYTGKFVAAGILPHDGRIAYDAESISYLPAHPDRARHEIALLDKAGGATLYGIDSLFTLLQAAVPAFKPVFRIRGFRWSMKQLYSFISYNRRVIAGQSAEGGCAPDFHKGWRLAFVTFSFLFALLGYYAFGSQLSDSPGSGLLWMAIAGIGWSLHFAWGLAHLGPKHGYAGQLGIIQIFSGLTFMVASLLLAIHPGLASLAMLLAFSSPLWLMVYHRPRLKTAGLSPVLAFTLPITQIISGAILLYLSSSFFLA